ncbi:MAG: CARDB domain-containing protein [Chloroflexota bacterium]
MSNDSVPVDSRPCSARLRSKAIPGLRAVLVAGMLALFIGACSLRSRLTQTPLVIQPTQTPTSTVVLASPDLVIGEINLAINSKDPCAPATSLMELRIQVKNQGDAPAGAFTVEANGLVQTIPGLAAGDKVTLHFPVTSQQVQVWVDVLNQVTESLEDNNRVAQQLLMPSPSPGCLQTPTPVSIVAPALAVLEGHSAEVWSVAFSPDGSLLASGSVDDTLRLWRVAQADLLRTMRGHPFPILALDFSPNGALLATGSTDGMLRIWRVSDGRLLQALEGHAGWITSLAFSPSGSYLASCAQDFTVRLWRSYGSGDADDLSSDWRPYQTIDEGMSGIHQVIFSPDGKSIAWGEENGTIRLRSLGGDWLHVLKNTSLAATSAAFSPNGLWLVAGYADGSMRVWQSSDGALLQVLKSHTEAIRDLAFSPDGSWLVSGSQDNTLRLWRVQAKVLEAPVLIYAGHSAAVNSVDFSPKGDLIVSASDDHTLRLWQAPPLPPAPGE